MSLYYAERRPSFLPLYVVGRLYPGSRVVLEKGRRGTVVVEATALNKDVLEVIINEPRVLVIGDVYEPHRGFLGELLNPQEIKVTESPVSMHIERKSLIVRKDKDGSETRGGYPLNRECVMWRSRL